MEWLPYVGAAVLGVFLTLVRLAIRSERGRGDTWREIAQTHEAANARMAGSVEKLIDSVEALSTSQRESLALLRTLVDDRRAAA